MQTVNFQPNALPAFPLVPGTGYKYYAGGPGNPGPLDSPTPDAPDEEPPADVN